VVSETEKYSAKFVYRRPDQNDPRYKKALELCEDKKVVIFIGGRGVASNDSGLVPNEHPEWASIMEGLLKNPQGRLVMTRSIYSVSKKQLRTLLRIWFRFLVYFRSSSTRK